MYRTPAFQSYDKVIICVMSARLLYCLKSLNKGRKNQAMIISIMFAFQNTTAAATGCKREENDIFVSRMNDGLII